MENNREAEKIVLLSRDKIAIAESYIEDFKFLKGVDGRRHNCWAASPYYKWWKLDFL